MSAKPKKTTLQPKSIADRAIAFKAPTAIHGALKQITGKLEMSNIHVDGRVPFERDILVWLVGELYMEGPEKWAERLQKASSRFKELASTN